MNKKNNRRTLFYSVISLLLCVSMLLGTTLAWFSDSVSSTGNIIKTGKLDVTMEYTGDLTGEWKDASDATIFSGNYWEPGYSDMKFIKVSNTGNLAFSYQMHILPAVQAAAGSVDLADVIDVYVGLVDANFAAPTAFSTQMAGMSKLGTLAEVMADEPMTGVLLPTKGAAGVLPDGVTADTGAVTYCVVLHMQEDAGNEYQNLTVGNNFTIQLVATQYDYEQDGFGGNYDNGSEYPELKFPEIPNSDNAAADVTVDAEGKLTEDVILKGGFISATVPAGTLLEDGVTKLTMLISVMEESESNIILGSNEEMLSLDVHVSGISENNIVPVIVDMGEVAPKYLNNGNLNLAHVENGVTVPMTRVDSLEELDAHNEYYYDLLTGELTLAMASFSEVAIVADLVNRWEGGFDYSWYNAGATNLTIANADQLAAFGAIVGGMKKVTKRTANGYVYSDEVVQDNFKGKTVKLISNISIGDLTDEDDRNIVFYPIGYYNSEGTYEKSNKAIESYFNKFEGTFDGNGHTISDFYQNTWEMKGDHNWYSAAEQNYRDGMGLFGKVYGGTVKNLTVSNFSSDGEITTTGVIAAYADCGATFENIAIFRCNPRVYNIGNGGIVGCVGWYANDVVTNKVTFRNITVDNSNKITSLWGSWDTACGGIVGQYYPTSGQSNAIDNVGIKMVNCHVAAQIDVYNDVCANYQYYAYRYAGMLVGSVKENIEENGYLYPDTSDIEAERCTVHFGDWNDYYYCELVANSLASYTHDHQMSRLEQVAKVEGNVVTYLNGTTETITGTRNFVVVKDKDANGMWIHGDGAQYATCYHFVSGNVWTHDKAGTETVDGVEGVLKEDKQLVYREFNNLITGDGWGVTSRGLTDFAGVTNMDIKQGDHEESVEKFAAVANHSGFNINKTYKVGDVFKALDGAEELIDSKTVQVFVSPADENSSAAVNYSANTTDWREGTLEFTGNGAAVVTITDYNFCIETTLNVSVRDYDYSVTYMDQMAQVGDTEYVTDNSEAHQLKTHSKANYIFEGWTNIAGTSVGDTIPAGNVTDKVLYAKWRNVYKVRFVDHEGVVKAVAEFDPQTGELRNGASVPADYEADSFKYSWSHYKSLTKGATSDIMVGATQEYIGVMILIPNYNAEGTLVSYTVAGIENHNSVDLKIPETVNEVPVVSVQNNAFATFNNLTTVTIPGSVTYLGADAFADKEINSTYLVAKSIKREQITIYYQGTREAWETLMENSDENWDQWLGEGTHIYFVDEDGSIEVGYYEYYFVSGKSGETTGFWKDPKPGVLAWAWHDHEIGDRSECNVSNHIKNEQTLPKTNN